MSVSIHDVLEGLRGTALDERDKGDKFERLVLNLPSHRAGVGEPVLRRLAVVGVARSRGPAGHRDRPGRQAQGQRRVRRDPVQVLRPDPQVSKGDIDTFLSASGGQEFVQPATSSTRPTAGPPTLTMTALHQASRCSGWTWRTSMTPTIDWSHYSWSTPEVLVPLGPKQLRPHQAAGAEGRDATASPRHDRGKLIMACGTGKTFTSLKIAEELVGTGGQRAVPRPVHPTAEPDAAGVDGRTPQSTSGRSRSAPTCGSGARSTDDADLSTIDLTEPATTDAATLVARMATGRRSTRG